MISQFKAPMISMISQPTMFHDGRLAVDSRFHADLWPKILVG